MPLNLSKGLYEQLLNLLGTLQTGNKDNDNSGLSSGAVNLTRLLVCYSLTTELGNLSCIDYWILDHRLKSITPYDL
ncbi:hypothetical protein KY289_010752 [Solanum tuberosum]|nr:hypothetical protein KY289_010752 [Solanum tuberosum]